MPEPENPLPPESTRAWEAAKAEILATDATGRLPSWRFPALRAPLKVEIEALRADKAAQAAVFEPTFAREFEALIERVDRVSLAGTMIQAAHERQEAPRRTLPTIAQRVYALRAPGMRALTLLETALRVSPEQAASIRRGTGHLDAAGDLIALAPLLKAHWPALAPLQQLIDDETQRLTEEDIDAMPDAAAALLEADRAHRAPAGDVDWYDMLRRATLRLNQDWDRLRGMSVGALAALNQLERALDMRPSLLSIQRHG